MELPCPRVTEQPGGQPAVVPLGADVGTGPDDGVHPGLGDQAQETIEIQAPGKVELPWRRRVRVPREVGLDRVQAHPAGLVDPVGPEIRVHAEVVQCTRDQLDRLAVEQEVPLADDKFSHQPVVTVNPCWLP